MRGELQHGILYFVKIQQHVHKTSRYALLANFEVQWKQPFLEDYFIGLAE